MYNRVILMGNLTKDPELSTTQNGISLCRISIAVNRSFVKQGQERQTDFFYVTCWGQQAEFVSKYFTKGRMIHIEGRIQNDNYTDQQTGKTVYRDQIIAERVDFCGNKSDGGGNYSGGQYGAPQNYGGNQYGGNGYNNGGGQYGAPQNYGGNQYGGQQYQQPAPQRQAAPAPQAPNPIEMGDLNDFAEVLSDGEVPF